MRCKMYNFKDSLTGFLWLCFESTMLYIIISELGYFNSLGSNADIVYNIYCAYMIFASFAMVWVRLLYVDYVKGKRSTASTRVLADVSDPILNNRNIFQIFNKLIDIPIIIGMVVLGHYYTLLAISITCFFRLNKSEARVIRVGLI